MLQRRSATSVVTTNALADRLGITPASASAMVKGMAQAGLVEHFPYRGVALTEDGRRVALEVMRHHRLLEPYLAEHLGVPWDRVHDRPTPSRSCSPRTSSGASRPSSAIPPMALTATRSLQRPAHRRG